MATSTQSTSLSQPLEKRLIQRMSAAVALSSLIILVLSFYFLPEVHLSSLSFLVSFILGALFFILYIFLPQLYMHETFLMLGDAIYIGLITYVASQIGDYGILILFLYFVIIAADALKYPISEYVTVVIVTLQAAFFYIILWSPFSAQAKVGILILFSFSVVSLAVFVWYFASQVVSERSTRFILERRSKYLRNINSHLKAIDRMRDNLMKVTSHEFQTPLTIVRNTLAELRESGFENLTPKQLSYLALASSSNQQVISLVKDLLSSSRIASGEWKLFRENVDLNKLVKDLINEYLVSFQNKKQEIVAELPTEPLIVHADRNLFRIAFKNLIDNAVKYTPDGGTISISLHVTLKEVLFSVQDTGIGIKREDRDRLFSQFFRTDAAILKRPEGFGIGLYYSRLIIRKHGGDISLMSRENEGSLFTIHLPKDILVTNHKGAKWQKPR